VSNAETQQNDIETQGFINNDLQIKQVVGDPKQVRNRIREIPNKRQIVALGAHRFDPGRAMVVYITNDVWDSNEHNLDNNFVEFLLKRPSIEPYVLTNMLGRIEEGVFVVNTTEGLIDSDPHVRQFFERVNNDLFNSYGFVDGAQTRESTLLFAAPGDKPRENAVISFDGIKPYESPYFGVETRNSAIGQKLILEVPYEGNEVKAVTAKQLASYASGEIDTLDWQKFVQVDDEILDIGFSEADNTVILTTAGDKRLRPVRITWENDTFFAVLLDELSIETTPDLEQAGNVSQVDRDGNVLTTRGENRNGIAYWPANDMPEIRDMLEQARNAPAAE
jgi:hypothetical protein